MFTGGLLFDTSAILYTNVLYIVMMLFPLHWKENNVWHRICQWVFVVVNSLAFAINLMDSVYFQYTMRRTTTTVFDEFPTRATWASIIGKEFPAIGIWSCCSYRGRSTLETLCQS